MNRPITLAMLFKFFGATWIILATMIGIAVQTRFNDLAHLQAGLNRVESLIIQHIVNDK